MCFETFFTCTFNPSEAVSIHFLNGGLHEVCIGKPSERMSNFGAVRFSKTKSDFPHIPIAQRHYRM